MFSFSAALLLVGFGFGCGVLITLWAVYKLLRYGIAGIVAVLSGFWEMVGGSAGVVGRIVTGASFAGIIAWHMVFDLNKNNWLDIQFLDEGAKWLAETMLWPSIKANIESYPIGIAAFFVWGARNIGLDVSGLDPTKYPSAAGAPPPVPTALV